jgi:cyclopropane fatty-acyl-phospholipid synthase-like methyltransferase
MIIDNNTGIWLNNSLEGHGYDTSLSNALVQILKKNNITDVYDFGCGHGLYTRNLLINKINCEGYDGNPNTKQITDNICNVLDLSKPFELQKKEYVITLEVGEHIPKSYEETFINNIHNHNTKGIILSWAIVGQGGDGHINCQNNDYIKHIFHDLGYKNNLEDENYLRFNSSFSWFRNTIMVFEK